MKILTKPFKNFHVVRGAEKTDNILSVAWHGSRVIVSEIENVEGRSTPRIGILLADLDTASPVTMIRSLLKLSKSYGSNAMSYHFAPRFASLKSTTPYLYFAAGGALSRKKLPSRVTEGIGRCHDYILREGKPVSLLSLIPAFKARAPELTEEIMAAVEERGVRDEYMVPVYGPFGVKAVISFGFSKPVREVDRFLLSQLEIASSTVHQKIIRFFGKSEIEVDLSSREAEVLKWISKGKSTAEIAIILDIRPSSVDTYTRRIFKKLGVNDRISATLKALREGVIDTPA